MKKIEEDGEYLINKLNEYRNNFNEEKKISRLLPSYFGLSYSNLGKSEVKLGIDYTNHLTIKVSANYQISTRTAYIVCLIPMALLYLKDNKTLPVSGTIIYDKDKDEIDLQYKEMYKQFGMDLIEGTDLLEKGRKGKLL